MQGASARRQGSAEAGQTKGVSLDENRRHLATLRELLQVPPPSPPTSPRTAPPQRAFITTHNFSAAGSSSALSSTSDAIIAVCDL